MTSAIRWPLILLLAGSISAAPARPVLAAADPAAAAADSAKAAARDAKKAAKRAEKAAADSVKAAERDAKKAARPAGSITSMSAAVCPVAWQAITPRSTRKDYVYRPAAFIVTNSSIGCSKPSSRPTSAILTLRWATFVPSLQPTTLALSE